jgi:hypothetical protein
VEEFFNFRIYTIVLNTQFLSDVSIDHVSLLEENEQKTSLKISIFEIDEFRHDDNHHSHGRGNLKSYNSDMHSSTIVMHFIAII